MKKLMLVMFFSVLLAMPLLNAQPPFQQVSGENGIDIGYFGIGVTEVKGTVDFNTQIFNTSTGLIITNTTAECFIHLHNSQGNHVLQEKMDFDSEHLEFYFLANGGNFSNSSIFNYIYWCNNSVGGGFTSGSFEVTENGNPSPTSTTIVFFSLLFILILIGMLGVTLYTVFKFINLNFDARDLIINVSLYFGLFTYNVLSVEYLGNAFINSFMTWLIGVGAVTAVIIPLCAFFASFFKNNMKGDHN